MAMWVRSDDARRRFERTASQALNRDVRVAGIGVGWDRVTLHNLTLSDPWSDQPALQVAHGEFEIRWSALWDGGLAGTLTAEAFSIRVRKRGRETNFHGMRRPTAQKRPLDIVLALSGGEVLVHDEDREERVRLEGVELVGRVAREDAQSVVGLEARADAVHTYGVLISDVSVSLAIGREGVDLDQLQARLGGGRIAADGRLGFDVSSTWSAHVEAVDVALRDEVLPIVVAAFPAAAGVPQTPEGRIEGRLSLVAEVEGAGLSPSSLVPTLRGRLRVELEGVVLPPETAVVRIAALLGRSPEPLALEPVSVEASLAGPWVRVDTVRSGGEPIALPFEGRVALDGRLDLDVDVLPLLQALPQAHSWARRYTLALPVRVEGTTAEPVVRAPSAATVARAVAGAWALRALDLHSPRGGGPASPNPSSY